MNPSNSAEVLAKANLETSPASSTFLAWLAQQQISQKIIAEIFPILVTDEVALLGNHNLYTEKNIIEEDQNFPSYSV